LIFSKAGLTNNWGIASYLFDKYADIIDGFNPSEKIGLRLTAMKHHPSRLRRNYTNYVRLNNDQGVAAGCLVVIIAAILIFAAIGVYVGNNYQTWFAHGIAAGMHALIDNSDLPQHEKSEISEIIDQLKNDFLVGDISLAELGLILEGIGSSPALPIGLVTQFEQSYVVPSGLNSDEKLQANINLNRLARGISGDQINWENVDEILAPISDPGEDGNLHLRSPAEVSDDDIREVLATVQEVVDKAGISNEKIEIDISEEFKKSVEDALGRPIG
jgi:hypothetical protein